VHLAHPAAIRKYERLKHSGVFADAAYRAQLLRLGLLAEGYVYPREERGARDLARKRMQLVRYRTAPLPPIDFSHFPAAGPGHPHRCPAPPSTSRNRALQRMPSLHTVVHWR
jgi:hypothetical protein